MTNRKRIHPPLKIVGPTAAKPAATGIPTPPDFTADERSEWQNMLDLIEERSGASQPDLYLLESLIRERRGERAARKIAQISLDEGDFKMWKTAQAQAGSSARNVRSLLSALGLAVSERSSKQTRSLKAKLAAEATDTWSRE